MTPSGSGPSDVSGPPARSGPSHSAPAAAPAGAPAAAPATFDAALDGAYVRPRDVVVVEGPDARSFCQGQLSQDIASLDIGSSAPSLLLSPQGKVVAFLRACRAADDRFVLDTDAPGGVGLAAGLNRFRLRVKATITEVPWACIALRGAAAALAEPGRPGTLVVQETWPGFEGVDVLGEGALAPEGVALISAEVWERARIAAGLPVMGAELDERTIPAEVPGLVERCVSFTKGCYTGQELVARLDARGANVARRLCRVVSAAGDAFARGDELAFEGKTCGTVTSAAGLPGAGTIGLAYVRRSVAASNTVLAGSCDVEIEELAAV